MEELGIIIKNIIRILKTLFTVFLYLFWGASRITETILKEVNGILKRVLESKHK